MRLAPKSLYGRLLLLLIGGLLLAQIISAALHLIERDAFIFRASANQAALRIADLIRIFDTLTPSERARLAREFPDRNMLISLNAVPTPIERPQQNADNAQSFLKILNKRMRLPRQVIVSVNEIQNYVPLSQDPLADNEDMSAQAVEGYQFKVSAQLKDQTWATYNFQLPRRHFTWPPRLLIHLAILVAVMSVLSLIAVRWITKPLSTLADAAQSLGQNINSPPLPEAGPAEVRKAAHAFNAMQDKLVRYIQSRTRVLAAMSHDLKTPITRLRLRAEMLEDEQARGKFSKDLEEMEAMVMTTLSFMRGMNSDELSSPIDVNALLESLQNDYAELGHTVEINGKASQPYVGKPQALKRCLTNLMDNAVKYGGGQVSMEITDNKSALTISVCDNGPGIPADDLEKVFEPFYRLEASRNRDSGGTGLGLSIARDIAQSHNGSLTLRNRERGGLEAVLYLPRA